MKVTWGKWQTDPLWLPSGELQAAALFDLKFPNNKLSVWSIDDRNSNLDRVLVALAVNKDKQYIERVDYVLLDHQSINNLGIAIEKSLGETPDKFANGEWHFDLIELTVSKIVALAQCMKIQGLFRKKSEPDLKRLIVNALKENHIDFSRIKPALRPTIERLASESTRN